MLVFNVPLCDVMYKQAMVAFRDHSNQMPIVVAVVLHIKYQTHCEHGQLPECFISVEQ